MVGAANQVAPASDLEVGNALRNKLFTNVHNDTEGNPIPGDLVARNIQRGAIRLQMLLKKCDFHE